MTDTTAPDHRDRARALRVVLAMLAGDFNDVVNVAAESSTDADSYRVFEAAAACLAEELRRRHDDPRGHIADWLAHELSQRDPADRDDESVVPTHVDRARALSAAQAMLHGDRRIVLARFTEASTPRSVDRLILAVCDSAQMYIKAKVDNPVGYVEAWVATELDLADDENGDADHE